MVSSSGRRASHLKRDNQTRAMASTRVLSKWLSITLWACRLKHKRVNIQTLHYCVQKELKLRIEQWEAANPARPLQEGTIIAIPPNEDVVVEQEDTSGRSGASPLTETDESTR